MMGKATNRREFLRAVGSAGLGAAALGALPRELRAAPGAAPAGGRKPNVILILADDLGYADLGCYGAAKIKTPNLDRMAAEGLRFTDFYVAGPVCSPTRASLMTGCYPKRVGITQVLFPHSRAGLNPSEITIADALKAQGYATACIGKWHLGDAPEHLPTRQGFDRYFGIPYSNDMGHRVRDGKGVPLMRDEKIIEQPVVQESLTERYTQEAVQFITEHKDQPFFLYFPHTFPHVPLFVSERFKGKSAGGLYGDVVECIDWSVGEVLATVKKLGLDENTLVIFTSDNGPALNKGANAGAATPLREGKATTCEGGMREPCLVRWPGRVPAGRTCSELATCMDLLPTLALLAGGQPPADRVIDGRDIRPLLTGAAGAKTPHEAFLYYSGARLEAIRSGKWKLYLGDDSGKKAKAKGPPRPTLCDLEADIGETRDVAAAHPDVVERLKQLAASMDAELVRTRRPVGTAGLGG